MTAEPARRLRAPERPVDGELLAAEARPAATPRRPDPALSQPPSTKPPDDAWRERALCAQTDPEAFFPEKGGSTREAKKVCMSCDVRAECLHYALTHDERYGIWGGTSERERRRLRNTPDTDGTEGDGSP
jgi:WhiB family redox-sensing transcriptional regulator